MSYLLTLSLNTFLETLKASSKYFEFIKRKGEVLKYYLEILNNGLRIGQKTPSQLFGLNSGTGKKIETRGYQSDSGYF